MKDKRQVQGFTINAICELTGYDRRTVTNRLQGVEPIGTEGKAQKFLIRQFIEACENRIRASLVKGEDGEALDPVYERARKDKELADEKAMANQVRRGELIEAEGVDGRFQHAAAIVIKHLEAMPTKAATKMVACTKPSEAEHELTILINDIRDELAKQ